MKESQDKGAKLAKEFELLQGLMNELIECTKVLLSSHNEMKKNDLYGRLVTVFLQRQLDHAISIIKLESSFDTTLIARTMIEGLFNLLWIGEEHKKRADLWNEYGSITNLKILEIKEKAGVQIDEKYKKEIIDKVIKDGSKFLTPKGKKAQDAGNRICFKQYYENFRCGKKIADLAEELTEKYGYPQHLYEFYKQYSDWTHWGKQTMELASPTEESQITYYEKGFSQANPALINSFLALLHTLAITNDYFSLGYEEKIKGMESSVFDDLGIES